MHGALTSATLRRTLLGAGLALASACQRPEAPPHPPTTTAPGAPTANAPQHSALPSAAPHASAAPAAPLPAPLVPAPQTRVHPGGPGVVSGRFGAVTSVEQAATRAGVEILSQGGNAMDAAVAVGFALAVTHPSAGNIGGGGFLLVRSPSAATEAIDFREVAPQGLTRAAFDAMIARDARDGAAVGVPGSVAGLHLAHQRHGRLPWRAVLAPAIRLARESKLGPRQALTLRWSWGSLSKSARARAIYAGTGGAPLAAGRTVRQPELARTLERIAEEGPPAFYSGAIAADLLATLRPHGLMTLGDLSGYRARVREPLRFEYRGWVVETMPPPSAGGVALTQTLLMLRDLEWWSHPRASAPALHLFAEATRRAGAERRFNVVDPDSLTPAQRAAQRARWLDPSTWLTDHPIDPQRATPSSGLHPLYAAALRELEHTTHFSVADGEGGVVSCTMTLSASFGAKLVSDATGVVLNNSVASFASVGDNVPVGGQRTTSSMAPTLVLGADQTVLVLGSPGGDTIPSTIAQVLSGLLDHGLSLDAAVDAPRIHEGFVPDEIGYERLRPLPAATRRALAALGHRVVPSRSTIGDANDLVLVDGISFAYADPREGGLALAAPPPAAAPPLSAAPPSGPLEARTRRPPPP